MRWVALTPCQCRWRRTGDSRADLHLQGDGACCPLRLTACSRLRDCVIRWEPACLAPASLQCVAEGRACHPHPNFAQACSVPPGEPVRPAGPEHAPEVLNRLLHLLLQGQTLLRVSAAGTAQQALQAQLSRHSRHSAAGTAQQAQHCRRAPQLLAAGQHGFRQAPQLQPSLQAQSCAATYRRRAALQAASASSLLQSMHCMTLPCRCPPCLPCNLCAPALSCLPQGAVQDAPSGAVD